MNCFATGLFVAGALIPRLSVGLDQAVALPRDSYMQDYYRYVATLILSVRNIKCDCYKYSSSDSKWGFTGVGFGAMTS